MDESSVLLLPLTLDNINGLFNSNIERLEDILDSLLLGKKGIKQGIIYKYDALECGELEELNLNLDNIMEARLFNDKIEIVLINDEVLKGHIAIEKNCDLVIDETYYVYHNKYSKLRVKKYLELDEDGQAYIKYLKPVLLYRGGQ